MKRLTPILVLAVAGVLAGVASAAVPANTAKPTISGTDKSGSTLTADTGSWSNSPTSFTYQWRRCATDGTSCSDITGATKKSYTLTTSDVHHTARVVVTAKNADGSTAATSPPTNVVGSASGPSNTSKPTVSGNDIPGETLTVSDGSWSPTPSSFEYQWQRCQGNGNGCLNIDGATSKTYSVRTADVGSVLRALVTAIAKGQTTVASGKTDVVSSATSTTVVTTTVQGNHAPTIKFVSLRRVGARVYARFRVCDDTLGKISVTERDHKTRQLSYRRRFTVYRTSSCNTFSRHWTPAARFRTKGRYVVTLRASDTSGALSRLVSKSLYRR